MRSGLPLKLGSLSFLIIFLLLCLSTALSYSYVPNNETTALLLALFPGASLSLLFFVNALRETKRPENRLGLRDLAKAMGKIEEEDFSVRLMADFDQEGNALRDRFNTMAAHLEECKKQQVAILATVEKGKKEWETTFDAVPDYVVLLDREQKIVRMNRAMADKLGVQQREVVGKFCCPVIYGRETAPDFCCDGKVVSQKKGIQKEIFEPRLGGHLLFSMSPVFDAAGEASGIVQVYRDINHLKETSEELKRARSFMQQVSDSIPETLLIIDNDYHILLANKAAKRKFLLNGVTADRQQPFCYSSTHGLDKPCPQSGPILCPLQEVKKVGMPVSLVHLHTDKHGQDAHEELSATPFFAEDGRIAGIIEVGRDVSKRLRLEEENRKLLRKEAKYRRDQSISTLAGGVAHDFNNSLTAVLGNAELLKFKMFQDQDAQKYIDQIISAVHKMTGITRQVLAYARGGKYRPIQLDITKTVEAALAELKRQKDCSGITVAYDYEEEVWSLLGDAGQLKQALVNILINSLEAMKERGGTLLVRVSKRHFPQSWECAFKDPHPPGDFVDIVIQDSGVGIPPEDFDRIFEPFFTTKFMGRGLGLPAALGIIQNHGGCLTLESKQNHGSTVHVLLPRLKEQGAEDEGAASYEKSGRKVLVVDDEVAVLEYVSTGLRLNGFEVITASNGFEAMEKVHQQKEEIGLVILDAFMPGLDGKEVYRQAKAVKPKMRIALSSGYDEQIALAGLTMQKGDIFLPKPYDLKALLELADNSVVRRM